VVLSRTRSFVRLAAILVRPLVGIAVLGVSLFVIGCAPQDPIEQDFNHLHGLLVTNDGVYVVPDRAWRREGVAGGSFRKAASLLVYIQNEQPDGLRVSYIPEGDTERFHFKAFWDDSPIWDGPRSAENGGLEIEMDAANLTPGLHHLRLDREKELDLEEDRNRGVNVFTRVSIERIDGGVPSHQPITPNGYLARFLDFGVTSQTSNQMSGCLFVGPQSHGFSISSDEDGEAGFVVQNRSREPARFIVTIDGSRDQVVEVEARGSLPVSFRLPSGRRDVTIEVEGVAHGCFLWGAPYFQRKASTIRPPVIVITLDTTRRDSVPPFGGRPELTPVLADLARSSTAFTNAYAVAPWTLPSHASIFTGLYPSHHRAGVVDDVLSRSWVTLAELYRRSGYRTAGFAGGSMASSRFGLAQGFDVFLDPVGAQEPANVITDAAIGFVEKHARDPLFLFLNYFDPHAPYAAPAEFQELVGVEDLAVSLQDIPAWGSYARAEPGAWKTIEQGGAPPSDSGLAYLRARYDAEVAFMDSEIGRFFDVLKVNGLFDPSLIVVVSDHGEFLGERGLFSHSYRLDRELTSIPLLVKWPHQKKDRAIDVLVSHVDLFPTIAGATGLESPASDGIGFSEASVGGLTARMQILMEEHESRFHQLPGPFRISGHLFGRQALDIREVFFPGFIECSRRSGEEWVTEECRSTWEQRIDELPAAMQSTLTLQNDLSAADLDEEDVERLRALGYLN